jgi:hypothetical protein
VHTRPGFVGCLNGDGCLWCAPRASHRLRSA